MTAVTNLQGVNVALLDVTKPFSQLNAGAGRAARLKVVEDSVILPTTFFSATANYARLCRFPANARIKRVELRTDAAVDAAATTGAAAFKVGVVFSDSTIDGTPVSYQGMQPTTVGIGGGSATPGTLVAVNGSNANFLFGTVTAPATTGPIPLTDITLGGVGTTYGTALAITETELVALFNLQTLQGNIVSNPGYLDLLILTSHAYTTVPTTTAELYARVEYSE